MKILISGGAAQSLVSFRLPLLRALRRARHDVHACAPDDASRVREKLADEGVCFHPVQLRRAAISPLQDLAYACAVYSLVRRLGVQGYFAYTHKPICFGMPAAAAAGARVRVGLVTGLGYAFTDGTSLHRKLMQAALRLLYRQALPMATHLYFQNNDDIAEFSKAGLLDDAPLPECVAGSGVPLEDFQPAPLPHGPPIFLMLARLLADKGVREYALAAAKVKRAYPQARFMLAGAFDANPSAIRRDEIEAWAQSGAVEYIGDLDDVRPALRACSVYVLPSYREGVPRSVLEAMAIGRPILTTDVPGCRETLLNLGAADEFGLRWADNGIAVPVASPSCLALAMIKLAQNQEMREACASRSREYAEKRFDAHLVASALAKPFL